MKNQYTYITKIIVFLILSYSTALIGAPPVDEQTQNTTSVPSQVTAEEEKLITCNTEAIEAIQSNQILLHVQGMVCGMCVQGITKLLSALEGVKSVDIELETGSVLITTQAKTELSDQVLQDAISRAGYKLQDLHRPQTSKSTQK